MIKKIGYDFDGVIMNNTSFPNNYGEMNKIYGNSFYEPILNHIYENFKNKCEIYIITKKNVKKIIDNYLENLNSEIAPHNISIKNIFQSMNKIDKIKELDLDEFYDDSPSNNLIFSNYKLNNIIKTKFFVVDNKKNMIYEIGTKDNIRIITYNVSWENTTYIKNSNSNF